MMRIPVRVYYEDTDCGGVVYYANYLRYFERGRTEFLRARGVSLSGLQDRGVIFVVTKAEAQYLSPCRYDDNLILETRLSGASAATVTFSHSITKEGSDKELVTGSVVLATVGKDGRPMRIPSELRDLLREG